MTERLYYRDCYLREFQARVIAAEADGARVYLDRTAFYPTSGGQPFDTGLLGGVRVVDVVDEEDRVAHVLASPIAATEAVGVVNWDRRYDHMQQHTGQHLLSAVLEELYRFKTLSFHMGVDVSTIELGTPELTPAQIEQTELRCAEIAAQAVPVHIASEDAESASGLRKASERTGELRIVAIGDHDRSACGGTHVRTSAEVAPILIRKADKVRGNVRIEFVCGLRAVRRAKLDFDALTEAGRALSVNGDQVAASIATLTERAKAQEKLIQKLAGELATREGRELYAAASPNAAGNRTLKQLGPTDDAMKTRAQAFTAGGHAVFLAAAEATRSILLATSADAGLHAGNIVKQALVARGGRGGGAATLAQGSAPSQEVFEAVVKEIGDLVL